MRYGSIATAAALLFAASTASAHSLACDKRVNGRSVYRVTSYPATLEWTMTVRNTHPDSPSGVWTMEDPFLAAQFGWTPARAMPFDLPVGGSHTESYSTTVNSYEECERLAHADGTSDDAIDNVFGTTWDLGEA